VRKPIVAIAVDHNVATSLKKQGLSWAEIFDRFDASNKISLTNLQADTLCTSGFAEWASRKDGFLRIVIKARFEAFTKLRDLSVKAGDYVAKNRRADWVGPFLRDQFRKPERSNG
jgi:excisionase family DNA binding protein